jgi:hypothetical protein
MVQGFWVQRFRGWRAIKNGITLNGKPMGVQGFKVAFSFLDCI